MCQDRGIIPGGAALAGDSVATTPASALAYPYVQGGEYGVGARGRLELRERFVSFFFYAIA